MIGRVWERGDARYLAGRSGDELFTELTGRPTDPEEHDFELSAGEWCGRVLCRAQWEFGCTFEALLKTVSLAELQRMFSSRRRAPVGETVDALHDRLYPGSALKSLRLRRGLSQTQLALVSGVTLRSIRAYEQGDLDISKAQYDTLCALAHSLQCSVPELMS